MVWAFAFFVRKATECHQPGCETRLDIVLVKITLWQAPALRTTSMPARPSPLPPSEWKLILHAGDRAAVAPTRPSSSVR